MAEPRQPGHGTGRHAARRNAMMVLYKRDLLPPEGIEDAVGEWEREHGFPLPEYARELVEGVAGERGEIDEDIERHLQDWRLERLGAVERAILRIAVHELRAGQVPTEVAMDEAIELARRYASPEAAKLVNGVLGGWLRGRQGTPG